MTPTQELEVVPMSENDQWKVIKTKQGTESLWFWDRNHEALITVEQILPGGFWLTIKEKNKAVAAELSQNDALRLGRILVRWAKMGVLEDHSLDVTKKVDGP